MIISNVSCRSVHNAATTFLEWKLPLHVLINNAGILVPKGQLGLKTEDGIEITYATNHFGPFYFTELLMEKVKESAPSRVVWQSSTAENFGTINWDDLKGENIEKSSLAAYGATKLFNILTAQQLQKELEGSGVMMFIVHPGIFLPLTSSPHDPCPAVAEFTLLSYLHIILMSSSLFLRWGR
eukprot:jgi/Botrbrau1/11830/Bobra.0224s0026.1